MLNEFIAHLIITGVLGFMGYKVFEFALVINCTRNTAARGHKAGLLVVEILSWCVFIALALTALTGAYRTLGFIVWKCVT